MFITYHCFFLYPLGVINCYVSLLSMMLYRSVNSSHWFCWDRKYRLLELEVTQDFFFLSFLFYRCGRKGPEKWSNLLKLKSLINQGMGFGVRTVLIPCIDWVMRKLRNHSLTLSFLIGDGDSNTLKCIITVLCQVVYYYSIYYIIPLLYNNISRVVRDKWGNTCKTFSTHSTKDESSPHDH